MIGWEEIYKVIVSTAPLYVALILGYGSIKWWQMFTPEQCDGITRFVTYFTLPLLTFDFTAHANLFTMNYLFIAADVISKIIVLIVLAVWGMCSGKGSYDWSITSFSLCHFTNSLVMGVPLIKPMYGQLGVDLAVQSSVIQFIVWETMLLFVLEFRRTRLDTTATRLSFWSFMKVVPLKLTKNPNSYACITGLVWAFISSRWHFRMPSIMEQSILIMSKAGTGTAMFSIGIFMALQKKVFACGICLTFMGMTLRFIAGPAAMALGSIAVGLQRDVLRVAIIQAALPQAITSFVFAKEYGLHAEVLSTAVIFGTLVSFPILMAYFGVSELIR